jgi:hypothetical protein
VSAVASEYRWAGKSVCKLLLLWLDCPNKGTDQDEKRQDAQQRNADDCLA